MRFAFWALLAACVLCGQNTPLHKLPYTPSLDKKFIDKDVDPCVDFFKYACGRWNKLNPMPNDQSRWDVYSKMADQNLRYLWGILEELSKPKAAQTPNEQKVGAAFGACMNLPAIEKAGTQPISAGLARISHLRMKRQFAGYVGGEHKLGLDANVLFRFDTQPDYDNSALTIADITAGGLALPDRDYYTKTDAKSAEIRQRYREYVAHGFSLLGEADVRGRADADSTLAIESDLARASLTREAQNDPYKLKHRFTTAKLATLDRHFAWKSYWAAAGLPAFKELNVSQPQFVQEIDRIIVKYQLSQWQAYFRWHLVNSHARYLPSPFEKAYFEFHSAYLRGVKAPPPRWKTCTNLVDAQLGEALGQVFIDRTFPGKTKQAVMHMVQEIEVAMGADIESVAWMSPATKKQALLKLQTILNKIGYPDTWRDYSALRIVPGDFAANVERGAGFEQHRQLARIGHPVDRMEWDMTPPTVNAYYDAQTNQMNFPAGVLLPPLYDPKMDDAPNYGNTASTIGHELTHGFDDSGRKFDSKGNLRDWWTPNDAREFEKRVSCVRDQYAKYVIIDDVHINSKLTNEEDVADLGGTMLAYLAWKHETANEKLEAVDGFAPDQRFFIGMAQWACGDERTEEKRVNATVDFHSPQEFRVNGVVSDMPEFARAFGCHEGQPMVNEKACRVW